MLSYSRCSDFYKCPYMFQCHDEIQLHSNAIQLGANIDMLLNCLMLKHVKDPEKQREIAVRLGVSDMLQAIVSNGDVCKMFDVPPMVKQWYVDFVESGVEVLDIQKHFVLDELDYHGYIDAVFWDGHNKIVVENKTTSRYYQKFFESKHNSHQAVGYAIAEDTDVIRYQFFNTKNMCEYTPYSRIVTDTDIKEFIDWVQHVKGNEYCFVKNREYCAYNDCPLKNECYGE